MSLRFNVVVLGE